MLQAGSTVYTNGRLSKLKVYIVPSNIHTFAFKSTTDINTLKLKIFSQRNIQHY